MSTQTMKAIVVEKTGGLDALQYKDFPRPEATASNVVVKNHAIGVNFIDIYHRSGLYPLPTPFVPGREGAGEIVAVGPDVKDYKVGDRVVYFAPASYAEYTAAPVSHVQKIGDISYSTATAAMLQGLTALTMVKHSYPVQKEDYILVHAAAGGVGLLLCQLCKLLGAHVIGTVSTPEKAELAKEAGAEYIINYSHEDVVEKVNKITGGLGCHAVFDSVGAATWEASLVSLRRLGTMVSFGNASGPVPPISIAILAQKNLRLMRTSLFGFLVTQDDFKYWWGELAALINQDKIKFKIFKTYKLADTRQAQEDLQTRKTTGKLLLEP